MVILHKLRHDLQNEDINKKEKHQILYLYEPKPSTFTNPMLSWLTVDLFTDFLFCRTRYKNFLFTDYYCSQLWYKDISIFKYPKNFT